MNGKKIFVLWFALFFSPSFLLAQEKNEAESGRAKLDRLLDELSEKVEVHGYAQGGYSYENPAGVKKNDFNMKRSIVWVKARVTDRWSFLFMHNFSNSVLEYYGDFRVTKDASLNIRLGQYKNSFSMENAFSPSTHELIDCGSQPVLLLAGGGLDPLFGSQSGRDIGLRLWGELFRGHLFYELALMNGQGINKRDGNNQKDVQLKFDFRPVSGLRVVASAQKGKGHAIGTAEWNPGITVGDDYRRDRYSIGAEWKCPSFSLRGEWLGGKDGSVGSHGGYLTTCVPFIRNTVDVIGSYDYIDRNTKMGYETNQATIGAQYWIYKKCRFQVQYTRCWCGFSRDYDRFQAQLQVGF